MQEATITTNTAEGSGQLTTDDLLLLIGQKEVITLSQKRMINTLTKELSRMQAAGAQTGAKSSGLKATVDSLSATNHKLDQALTESRIENQRLREEKKEMKAQMERYAEQIQDLQKQVKSLKMANASLSGKLKKAQARLKNGKHH